MFCCQHGFKLWIVDMGVDHDLSAFPDIINRKIARGTDNFRYGPAMTEAQFNQAIHTGAELVDRCAEEGCTIIGLGEMGIAFKYLDEYLWKASLEGLHWCRLRTQLRRHTP